MTDYRFVGLLLLAGLFALVGFGAFGYAVLVAGQLLLGAAGFAACAVVASVLVSKSR
ncbi:hypothetical protein [Halogeometricum pallidum]|uniref:hypothetical protein n=1 Tax=Halogeometricum pallidum TaxID=411361 RepID=UPI001360B1B8|nr:hypothetical protein [Halogeometricum pallidum]